MKSEVEKISNDIDARAALVRGIRMRRGQPKRLSPSDGTFRERVSRGRSTLWNAALVLAVNWLVIAWWVHYSHHASGVIPAAPRSSSAVEAPVAVGAAPRSSSVVETEAAAGAASRSVAAREAVAAAAAHGNVVETETAEAAARRAAEAEFVKRQRTAAARHRPLESPPEAARVDPYATENGTLVVGMERCAAFRASNPKVSLRRFAPAGLFNSATNALWRTVLNNCKLTSFGRHDLFQTPWGKHNPASWRGSHTAAMFSNSSVLGWSPNLESVLPLVILKDPLTWMPSICRNPYAVALQSKQKRSPTCPSPHLDAPVSVAFQKDRVLKYDGLVDLWSDWHAEYATAAFPRLMVRFEDLLFDPIGVARHCCDCLGGVLNDRTTFIIEGAAKGKAFGHGVTNSRRDALELYSSQDRRLAPYSPEDLAFIRNRLQDDPNWRTFQYDRGVPDSPR